MPPERSIPSDSESSCYSGLSEDESTTDEENSDESKDMQNNKGESSNVKDQGDTSDEEDLRNTVGNIPMKWYDDYEHLGYDWEGEKILKPVTGDELDEFMRKMEDPNYWRTVSDPMTGQNVILSDADVDLIQRIQKSKYADPNFEAYEPFIDFFTNEVMPHAVTNHPPHKRSFIPSKSEKEKVGKLVHAIKMGWLKPFKPKDDTPKYYLLWEKNENEEQNKRLQNYIPAPKLKLPGHEESYNPPPEYLLTPEEEEKWKSLEPEERKINFIPKKYPCFRLIPAYTDFIKERFERCLDLYLCPRQRKMRVNVDPDELVPKLPKPKDLQPFPSTMSIVYEGHTDIVRCISFDPNGQFFASGSDDKTLRIWEVLTGRCWKVIKLEGIMKSVDWCPNVGVCLLAVTVGNKVHVVNPSVGDKNIISYTDELIGSVCEENLKKKPIEKSPVTWEKADDELWKSGFRLSVTHPNDVQQITWHKKGDYFATVLQNSGNQSVMIHQLSKCRSQIPFKKTKGLVQKVMFHPIRPFFFVATQRYVRIYNLVKQELAKRLTANCRWISSLAIHPQGDNLIIGSYDSRLCWFDLDLSNTAYKTLRYHKKAARQVAFSQRYPLFASASDDGTIIVSHGMVYSDLLQNPLLVPVKVLKGHEVKGDLGVLDCCFHPYQPWILSSGADCTIRLYT